MHQTEFPPMAEPPAAEAAPAAPPEPVRLDIRFHGSAGEYFGIWIVNLLLSVLTLGIYSAWAKVRTQRYFYGNTELAGSRFEYHAKPLAILKGRLIGLALMLPYTILSQTHPAASLVFLLLLLAATPWLIVRALRFRLHNASYRNLRFGFTGTTGQALKYFIGLPLLGVLSLGLAMPWAQHQQRKFIMDRSRYGDTAFQMRSCIDKWYIAYLIMMACTSGIFGVLFIVGLVVAVVVFLSGMGSALTGSLGIAALVLAYVVVLAANVVATQTLHSWLANQTWNVTTLDRVSFVGSMKVVELAKLHLGNCLALLFSLGLALPWVKVRTLRYRLEHLAVLVPGGMAAFEAMLAQRSSATGEEIADLFDIDVAL